MIRHMTACTRQRQLKVNSAWHMSPIMTRFRRRVVLSCDIQPPPFIWGFIRLASGSFGSLRGCQMVGSWSSVGCGLPCGDEGSLALARIRLSISQCKGLVVFSVFVITPPVSSLPFLTFSPSFSSSTPLPHSIWHIYLQWWFLWQHVTRQLDRLFLFFFATNKLTTRVTFLVI